MWAGAKAANPCQRRRGPHASRGIAARGYRRSALLSYEPKDCVPVRRQELRRRAAAPASAGAEPLATPQVPNPRLGNEQGASAPPPLDRDLRRPHTPKPAGGVGSFGGSHQVHGVAQGDKTGFGGGGGVASSKVEHVNDRNAAAARLFSISRDASATWRSDTLLRSDSRRHRELLQRLTYVAQFERATILLEGESGTGKSALAQQIHLLSPRSGGPFVEVNVAAIDDALVSSELFGHLPGAFTGASSTRRGLVASALGGTLFLDEIGKASRAVQHRLLTLLERRVIRAVGSDREAPVDVRLVAATNVPVSALVEQGVLLSDLAPRLTTHRFRLPPLRDRPQDVPAIARACVLRHYRAYGYEGEPPELDAALVAAMCLAPWPDNIRGLDNAVQRLLVAAEGRPHIGLGDCDTEDLRFLPLQSLSDAREELTPDNAEKLVELAGSISGAARLSGRARSTIQRQLDKKDSVIRAGRFTLQGDVARQHDGPSSPVARQVAEGEQ